MSRPLEPPGGFPPPEHSLLAGREVPLEPAAREICRRYREEFPDEQERYGEAGNAWCVHDNQHILNWTLMAVDMGHDLDKELLWLAGVLHHRDFPLERLVRNLHIAAEVVEAQLGADGAEPARRLRAGGEAVRAAHGLPA